LISHAQRFDDTTTSLARTLIKLGTQLGHPAVGGVEIPHYVVRKIWPK
jgi:hypothetical protein